MEPNPVDRRTLTKIRRHFTNRTPSESDLLDLESTPQPSTVNSITLLNSCVGLVEINGKIHVSLHFINSFITILSTRIENFSDNQVVTLNIQFNPQPDQWEDIAQKLMNSGNQELEEWGYRMKLFHENRKKSIKTFLDFLHSKDPSNAASLRKAKAKAVLKCREIEDRHAYRKVSTYVNCEKSEILSISYSEGFLAEMGYELEEFRDWAKENGIPPVFDENCPEHILVAKNFWEYGLLKSADFIVTDAEYFTDMIDKYGNQHKVRIQNSYVLEPAEEGFFISSYCILHREKQISSPNETLSLGLGYLYGSPTLSLENEQNYNQMSTEIEIEIESYTDNRMEEEKME